MTERVEERLNVCERERARERAKERHGGAEPGGHCNAQWRVALGPELTSRSVGCERNSHEEVWAQLHGRPPPAEPLRTRHSGFLSASAGPQYENARLTTLWAEERGDITLLLACLSGP